MRSGWMRTSGNDTGRTPGGASQVRASEVDVEGGGEVGGEGGGRWEEVAGR